MGVVRDIEPWDALLAAGREDQRLVSTAAVHRRASRPAPFPNDLHPDLARALQARGVDQLWSHQAAAWEASARSDVIVTTGTASGKSLAFNLPVLNELVADPRARALYLYPSKALAQDQARALAALGLPSLHPAIYDGDTPRESRAQIRRQANLILTNPDMLHMGILPNHEAWRPFLANLSAVVVDEAHAYRGVFGSHVANVLRRLRRLVGHDVRFLMASATIANPAELATRLTGLPEFALVDEDGSPGARKTVAMWNPPLTDEALGIRRSVLAEAADVVAELVREGARTICFMKSRRAVELLSRFVRDQLEPAEAARVAPYRAGYTPQQRREIERRLVEGELLAVISTDALELGIDIGELDAAVVVTFPGTVASLRQMWGRAGRRGSMGLAVYVAGEDALDQFFCRHPDEFFDRAVEAAILDHASEQIYAGHLVCAAHEAPLTPDDEAFFEDFAWHAERLVVAGELHRDRRGRYVPRHAERFPAADVSLRSASADAFAVVNAESGELIGTVEAARAFTTIHEGAVYLHMGVSYEVRELDLDGRMAMVAPFKGDWYTQPKKETMTEISRLLDRRSDLGVTLSFGIVEVTETVIAYQRKRMSDGEQIDLIALDLPTTAFSTQALWYEVPDAVLGELPMDVLLGSLHAAEHSQIAVLPLLAMCDRWDIGGLSTNLHPQTGGPTIFIYDGHPGGIGITRRGFLMFESLVSDAHRLVSECPCKDGCPSCVQSPKCGNLNDMLHKAGCVELMGSMLDYVK